MSNRNCHCGRVTAANCTRCGAGVCESHLQGQHYELRGQREYGKGKTLAEAAYMRGYNHASTDRYLCNNCRAQDGRQHQQRVTAQSRGWQKDPFRFALSAACMGYVIEQPQLTYPQVVQSWIALRQPLERVVIGRVTRPATAPRRTRRGEKPGKAPERTLDQHTGWVFERTVQVEGRGYDDTVVWSWGQRTSILQDGRVFHGDQLASQPLIGNPSRLIVEMARKLFVNGGKPWHGPPVEWD